MTCKCKRNMVMGNGKGTGAVRYSSTWFVTQRREVTARDGGLDSAERSTVFCPKCRAAWRTKAQYVHNLPDEPALVAERALRQGAVSQMKQLRGQS